MKCLLCKSKLTSNKIKFCSKAHLKTYRQDKIKKMTEEKRLEIPMSDKELDDFIKSYAPNASIPHRRGLKIILANDIKFLKNKLPMSVPHPEKEGELLTISLDTFMQGEKI